MVCQGPCQDEKDRKSGLNSCIQLRETRTDILSVFCGFELDKSPCSWQFMVEVYFNVTLFYRDVSSLDLPLRTITLRY